MSAYIGRFAPSPTGTLHRGSLVAAVASYADALAHDGLWLLRIEDVDETRALPGATPTILAQLATHGFVWPEAPFIQSQRKLHYEAALARLTEQALVYACTCSRKQQQSLPLNAEGERRYLGHCRRLSHLISNCALRFLAPDGEISFVDRVCGPQAQSLPESIGDFVIRRADGLFAYQLAVVVDDALQGVTHVVRGADLLSNTPRQIALQRALGFAEPAYMHVPIVRNERGEKLSKQTLAATLDASNPVSNLREAWRFLGQVDFQCATVEAFWKRVPKLWEPGRVCRG